MIYLLHGADSYQVRQSLEAIRGRLTTPDGLLASNTFVLDGAKLQPLELLQQATTIPFLAPARLVIVEGLLAAIASNKARKKKDDIDPVEQWRAATEQLSAPGALPETTTLVLVEDDVGAKNIGFTLFAPIAQTKDHPVIKPKEIGAWIRAEAKSLDLKLSEKIVRVLGDSCGSDLWAIHGELRKIQAFTNGEDVEDSLIEELIGQSAAARLWDLTDAVVAGNERKAIETLSSRLTAGDAAPMILSMIARQYRQLVIAKDLSQQRAPEGEIARATGVPSFKVSSVVAQASHYSWADLRRAYELLVEADLNVKRGVQDDESSLQLLIHQLLALAPRPDVARRRR